MKKAEIKVGGVYSAKVSGKLTTVRVDSISEVSGYVSLKGSTLRYNVTNLTTGRKTTCRSAAKFRSEFHGTVEQGRLGKRDTYHLVPEPRTDTLHPEGI